jgi:molybdate/tungstate transport system substrate-binding protein
LRAVRIGVSSSVFALVVVAAIVVGAGAYTFYATPGSPRPLISYSADAYSTEAAALLSGFSQSTGIPVAPVKSGGSFADASQIAAGAPDDVFISVSLSATGPKYLKNLSANWAIGFASDQMVLAYSNSSSAAPVASMGSAAMKSNSTSAWDAFYTSLGSGSVKVGIADPVADPAGLRGWLALEAAGYLYSGGNQGAYVSTMLRSGANVTGAHAAALVAPLESGQIQFLFIYKSAAIAHHLAYIALDRHVNLGDPALGAFYSRFSYRDSAGTSKGAPIILCVTVPLSSGSALEALRFVQYVVRNAWTLAAYGLHPFQPALLYSNLAPPPAIAQLVSQGLVVQAGSLQ